MDSLNPKGTNENDVTPSSMNGAIEGSDPKSTHANRDESLHRHRAEPTHRQLKHRSGGTVQPLRIVDRNENWRARSEASHDRHKRHPYRALIRCPPRSNSQKSRIECFALRDSQRGDHLAPDVSEKITKAGERQPRF